jgi:hypothetical protein
VFRVQVQKTIQPQFADVILSIDSFVFETTNVFEGVAVGTVALSESYPQRF